MGRKSRARKIPARLPPSKALNVAQLVKDLQRQYGDLDAAELELVAAIRDSGGSWADVGQAFEISAPGALKRFGGRYGA